MIIIADGGHVFKSVATIKSFDSFKMGVNAYWLRLSPEAHIYMDVLLKSKLLLWGVYLQHPVFQLGHYSEPWEMNAIFNTILTRNHLVEGSQNLSARVDSRYAELAIWLIKNWNFEEKDKL